MTTCKKTANAFWGTTKVNSLISWLKARSMLLVFFLGFAQCAHSDAVKLANQQPSAEDIDIVNNNVPKPELGLHVLSGEVEEAKIPPAEALHKLAAKPFVKSEGYKALQRLLLDNKINTAHAVTTIKNDFLVDPAQKWTLTVAFVKEPFTERWHVGAVEQTKNGVPSSLALEQNDPVFRQTLGFSQDEFHFSDFPQIWLTTHPDFPALTPLAKQEAILDNVVFYSESGNPPEQVQTATGSIHMQRFPVEKDKIENGWLITGFELSGNEHKFDLKKPSQYLPPLDLNIVRHKPTAGQANPVATPEKAAAKPEKPATTNGQPPPTTNPAATTSPSPASNDAAKTTDKAATAAVGKNSQTPKGGSHPPATATSVKPKDNSKTH